MTKSVIVYSIDNCQPCRLTKRALDNNNIYYREINMDENPDIRQEVMQKYNPKSAPVVVVSDIRQPDDETYWTGFRPDLIKDL